MHIPRPAQIAAIIGIVCLGLLALINGAADGLLASVPHPLQFALFYAGLILLVWGFIGGRAGFATNPNSLDDNPWTRREISLLVAVTAFALVLRLWMLETSVHILVDELSPMSEILSLWHNPTLKMLQPYSVFSPSTRLYASWQAMSVAFLGRNLSALRFPSVILGTLTVIAVYLLGRTLFNRRIALIAALLLAVFPPHIQFSRLGLLNIADPLFGVLALVFFARALRFGRSPCRVDWVLGGAALGLTQYFHEGGRLLFPPLIMLWLALHILRHRRDFARWRRGLLLAGTVAVIIALPVYFTLAQVGSSATERMSHMALTPAFWATVLTSPPDSPLFDWFLRHITDPALLFINKPELSPYFAGDQALLLPYMLPALLLGLLWTARSQAYSGGRLLILLWLLATWVGNILLVDSALSPHYLVVFPALMLIIALGIDQTAAHLPARLGRWLLPAYLALCVIGQVTYYFGPYLDTFNRQIRGTIDTDDAIFRAAQLPPGTQVILLGSHPDRAPDFLQTMLLYLADDVHLTLLPSLDGFDFAQLSHPAYAFFIPPDDSASVPELAAHFDFPAPQYTPYTIPAAQTYTLYVIPAAP